MGSENQHPLGFARHDHRHCVQSAIGIADQHCAREGLRFTPVRRKVLELLLQEHRALGAYALLDLLKAEGFGSQPPVAYRALEFLQAHGFVHKIERLNAYVACVHPASDHAPAFMICTNCQTVAETHVPQTQCVFGQAAQAVGFDIDRTVYEAEGLCSNCQEKPAS